VSGWKKDIVVVSGLVKGKTRFTEIVEYYGLDKTRCWFMRTDAPLYRDHIAEAKRKGLKIYKFSDKIAIK